MMLALALLLSNPFCFAEPKVVVAVVDTGIDSKHLELKDNLWHNDKGEIGWDFVTKSSYLIDINGHGTHIAGIIAADANAKVGTSGVSHHALIMAVRYYSESAPGSVNLANTVQALNYAVTNGAQIINYSGGGPEYAEEEYQALKRAENRGVLVVTAAGNDHHNTDEEDYRYYPAAYSGRGLTNIISVGGLGLDDKMTASSNFGKKSVDLAVTGEAVLSTIPGSRFAKMTGTSQSTAYVSGIAAEILYKHPGFTPVQLKAEIFKKCSVDPKLPVHGGRFIRFAPAPKTQRQPAVDSFKYLPYIYEILSLGGASARQNH